MLKFEKVTAIEPFSLGRYIKDSQVSGTEDHHLNSVTHL